MKTVKVFKYIGFGILGVGAMFFFVWLVMLLWNALIPELFNGPVLSYWQTAGVFVLAKILLSGFSSGGGRRSRDSKSKWESKFRDKYRRKCKDDLEGTEATTDTETQPA